MRATSGELAIFISVVESGSSSRAAEQLEQANSAVSWAVKRLEMKFGIDLLNRTARQLNLVEEGERYFRRTQSTLQEMATAESEIMEMRNTPRGLLQIDAVTPVVLHFLIPLIRSFRERYPEVTLSLVFSETIISLIERKVDVAVRTGTLTNSNLRARPLFNSYRKIIASPDYISCCGKSETIDNLKQHVCLRFAELASLSAWPIVCSDRQLHEVKYSLSSNSEETLKQLCLNDDRIVCLSDYTINREVARGELVELMADKVLPMEMPFSAVCYSDRAVSTRIQAFTDFLSERVKTAPGGAVRET